MSGQQIAIMLVMKNGFHHCHHYNFWLLILISHLLVINFIYGHMIPLTIRAPLSIDESLGATLYIAMHTSYVRNCNYLP